MEAEGQADGKERLLQGGKGLRMGTGNAHEQSLSSDPSNALLA